MCEPTKTPGNHPVPDLPLLKQEHAHFGDLLKYVTYLNYICTAHENYCTIHI